MRPFAYLAPRTLPEAAGVLARHRGRAQIIAGGTDILVEIKENLRRPDCLVDLGRIAGLDRLSWSEAAGLTIGARVTIRQIENSAIVRQHYGGLQQAAALLGSVQIRNRATVAGNLCRASPSADMPPPLMAAGARVTLWSPAGERTMALEAFFSGPGQTRLAPDEILTRIVVPPPEDHSGLAYLKHGRRKAMELATVGVAVALSLKAGVCREARIVLGAVAPTPIRTPEAEARLAGSHLDDQAVAAASRAAMAAARPISDIRGSAEYRREMVGVLTERAILEARQRAGGFSGR